MRVRRYHCRGRCPLGAPAACNILAIGGATYERTALSMPVRIADVDGWIIPQREPVEVTLARIRELQGAVEPHISNQHVVSRAILKGFAAPGPRGRGWLLMPFDVKRKTAKKPLGV